MNSGERILLIILAIVVGEASLILLTTLAQEVLFNGIDYHTSSFSDILLGGLATFLAAVLAGMITTLIVKGRNYWPHIFISVIIIVEMTYLIVSGVLTSPIWFDVLSGISLIIGIWLGYFIFGKLHFTPRRNFG